VSDFLTREEANTMWTSHDERIGDAMDLIASNEVKMSRNIKWLIGILCTVIIGIYGISATLGLADEQAYAESEQQQNQRILDIFLLLESTAATVKEKSKQSDDHHADTKSAVRDVERRVSERIKELRKEQRSHESQGH